ncbi:hypothetical protein N1851_026927 [Merluccius polli]|uniref:Uncharacterized protein n=1 Tax=Merluccius polli TaxID=89951 RepID=A0AA47MAX6_MERPO|nr:hypothetical protein N1851_026927 [Merluccius polli]
MDCTPDKSHTEQLSIVIDIHLEKLKVNISDCHGQSYDNGSNMQGTHQGVQKRVLDTNNKVLCVPSGSQTLNLVIGDAAKSSVWSVSFYRLLQRLNNLFSSSVQWWEIMQEHVQVTIKNLSTTRWECRIDSVKALQYQMPQCVEALAALTTHALEKKDSETVSTSEGILKEMKTWSFILFVIISNKQCQQTPAESPSLNRSTEKRS